MVSILKFLPLAAAVGKVAAFTGAEKEVCPAIKWVHLKMQDLCPVLIYEPVDDMRPWTHKPVCMDPQSKKERKEGKRYCVFTRSDLYDRGVSVVASTGLAVNMTKNSVIGDETQRKSYIEEKKSVKDAYEIKKVDGKGLGVVATKKIKQGDVFMTDVPSIIVAREVVDGLSNADRQELQWLALLRLPNANKRAVRALAKSRGRKEDETDDLMLTNSLGLLFEKDRNLAILAEGSRINHDCRPNAYYRFDEEYMIMEFFALRDISPGEEITVSYLDHSTDTTRAERQGRLKSQWNFDCHCSRCTAPSSVRAESDERMESLAATKDALSNSMADPRELVKHAREIIKLLKEENLFAPQVKFLEIAAYASSQLGNGVDAQIFASEAMELWEVLAGKESEEVKRMKAMMNDPTKHPSWRMLPKNSTKEAQKHGDEDADEGMCTGAEDADTCS